MSKRRNSRRQAETAVEAPETAQATAAVDQDQDAAGAEQGETPKYKTVIALMDEKLPELESDGKTHTQELLDLMYLHFPNSKGTAKDVAWHRNRLRNAGVIPPVVRLTPAERKLRKAEYEKQFRARKAAERQAAIAARQEAAPVEATA